MYLRAHFKKAVVTGLMALTLAGCSSPLQIGGTEAQGPLQGQQTTATLQHSGAEVTRVTIPGSALKSGMSYTFNNVSVTVKGDLPPKVTIDGNNGQLLVTGNAGRNDNFSVTVPENTQTVHATCSGLMYYGSNIWMPYTYDCPSTVDTGPQAPFNKDPVIVVQGHTGAQVKFSGSAGVQFSHKP